LLQASGDTILCSGASVQLNAASGNNVTYSWSPASGLNNPAVNNPVASPTSPTVYVGDPLTLTASGGDIYQWGPAETVVSPTAASTQVKPVSNTNYQVIIVNSLCKLSDTLYSSIVVTNKLTTTVTKSNDLDCVLASTTLQATGGNQYSWSPNTNINQTNIPNPVVSPLETTTYYVVIKKNGCEVKDSITVVVTPANADNAYKMASAFTPNGDGLNDCFGVKYWGGIKTFLFEVYNRWGNRLFYTTDPSKCWDGTYKGQYQPTGTYVYQIKAETICGNIYKKGTVVIIR
jgi:gliding motility-associated-like protein